MHIVENMYHSHLAKMLGEYLLEQRRKRGITQRDFAKTLGFSAQFLGQIEAGQVMIPQKALARAIRHLHLDYHRMKKIYREAAHMDVDDLFKVRSKKKRRAG